MPKISRLKITDTTLRDAHQSLLATRMETKDMLLLAEKMDEIGFHSMEVWGGATFDVCLRFLNEDPWERLKSLKKLITKTPLQMLLRGRNLVGYRPYADDVIESFIIYAAECGIDIFRIFDALNDENNLKLALKTIKKCGKHAQLAICYSLTEQKMGGPVYNLDYFVNKAEIFREMGADSICIKDMAGLLSPDDARKLIKTLKRTIEIPLQLHCHYTSGLASMTYLKAIEAGIDIVDTALSPFALRSSQPAIEPFLIALQKTKRDTGLNLAKLLEIADAIESIAPKYRGLLDDTKISVIDAGVFVHQIPGGMISNLINQLRELNALEKLNDVFKEIGLIRMEFGYPPLVTPASQIIGAQAVQNVLLGRYKLISTQARDYLYGLYGKPPAPVDNEVKKMAMKGYRPNNFSEIKLNVAKKEIETISQNIGDILIQALYDKGVGMDFLKRKYKKEE